MTGIQTEYFLGIGFIVLGLSELLMPPTPKTGALVKFIGGILLVAAAVFAKSLI